MSSPFEVSFSRQISEQTHDVQLLTTAPTAAITNTSTSANVVLNVDGPALLSPPTGVVLEPGDSTTVNLLQSNGGELVLSAIATGPNATISVVMVPVTDHFGGLELLQPGTPLVQPDE